MRNRFGRVLVGIVGLVLGSNAHSSFAAEPTGKWFLGGSLAFRSTTDEITNNASVSIGSLGADGIPFTYDAGETTGCSDPNTYCDPRPDHLLNSPARIGETFQYNIHAGYRPMRWLSIQLDAAYFKASVGPVDAYLADHYPVAVNPLDPTSLLSFHDRDVRFPIDAGEITEIPVSISAIVQFKTKSVLKPYLGVGIGKIFSDLETTDDVEVLNERVSRLRIRTVADKFGQNVTPRNYYDPLDDAHFPLPEAVTVELTDTTEWHLTGGAEWLFSDRVGVVFDATYMFAPGGIRVDVAGHDQVDLLIWSEKIYHPNGTLKIFNPGYLPRTPLGAPAPNTLCFDSEFFGLGCDHELDYPPDARVNPEAINPATGRPYYTCPAMGDFDVNGTIDICYGRNISPSPKGFLDPRGDVVMQGGEIGLSAFTLSVGLRLHL